MFALTSFRVTILAAVITSSLLTGTVDKVLDGDTIKVGIVTVRLYGIDAPENKQTCLLDMDISYSCGLDAANVLRSKVVGKRVNCTIMDVDRYGRLVARCKVRGLDLSKYMAREGLAVAYREYSTDYVDEELKAQKEKKGMWIGTFQLPSEYRKQN